MYHYTECGLDNVWLANGVAEKETSYGRAVAIRDVEKLHAAIADALIRKPGRLTGKEFRFLRTELGLSQKALARLVEADEDGVARWERGVSKVPGGVDRLIRAFSRERIAGNARIEELLTSLAERNDTAPQRITLRLHGGWKRAA